MGLLASSVNSDNEILHDNIIIIFLYRILYRIGFKYHVTAIQSFNIECIHAKDIEMCEGIIGQPKGNLLFTAGITEGIGIVAIRRVIFGIYRYRTIVIKGKPGDNHVSRCQVIVAIVVIIYFISIYFPGARY